MIYNRILISSKLLEREREKLCVCVYVHTCECVINVSKARVCTDPFPPITPLFNKECLFYLGSVWNLSIS